MRDRKNATSKALGRIVFGTTISQRIWRFLFSVNVFYLLILFILPHLGYTLRGSFYTTPALGLGVLLITTWFIRPHSLIQLECNQKQINILVCALIVNFIAIMLQSFAIYISGMGGASYPCFREFNSPSHRLIFHVSACQTMTVQYSYSINRNYGLIQKQELVGSINPSISGKWLGDRFEHLYIQWDEQETSVTWEIKDYKTTSSHKHYYGEDNPIPPLRGIIRINQ